LSIAKRDGVTAGTEMPQRFVVVGDDLVAALAGGAVTQVQVGVNGSGGGTWTAAR
jgi:hypothetical protein